MTEKAEGAQDDKNGKYIFRPIIEEIKWKRY